MNNMTNELALSRRQMMGGITATALLLAAGLTPLRASQAADTATEGLLSNIIKGRTVNEGRISLDVPEIAENGNTVPVAFEIDSPMTDDDYVQAVHVMADGNPAPEVASFSFTPMNGLAAASIRIRLAKTQNVVVLAEMNDGSVYMAKSEVKVTIGGCGG